jgi:uncharacterized protein YdeI (YjbR/CyaY-like superfamily)
MIVSGPGSDALPGLLLSDADGWRDWLAAHHQEQDGVWLVLHKKGGDVTSLTYAAALDEALCFGWIDGQARSRDAASTFQRFTPRRARSRWSLRNTEHIARLQAQGRMQPAGVAQVEAAKADGRWDAAYRGPATTEPPSDLLAALAQNATARAWFEVLTSRNRYAICQRVADAKTASTRTRRIAQYVEDLAAGKTPYPQRRNPKV